MEVEAGEDKKKIRSEIKFDEFIHFGSRGFLLVCFCYLFHFSPTWMPCPKHFAISPRIYCSFYWFYWFYWVSRHLLDALAGSSCSVSLDFFSSVFCGFLSVFHLRYMPEQSHFHVVSWPTESRLYALEKHGKMKRHQMKPDLRPTINRQYGGVKLVIHMQTNCLQFCICSLSTD